MTEAEATGLVGTVTTAAARTLGTLPAQFLALVLMTACFNLGMIYFFVRQGDARERVLTPLITACANSIPIEVLKYLPKQQDDR